MTDRLRNIYRREPVSPDDFLPVPSALLEEIQALVDQQAKDEGLWFQAETASEAYLQQELRRLHALIEGDSLE